MYFEGIPSDLTQCIVQSNKLLESVEKHFHGVILLCYEMHAMVDAKEEVYHANILVQNCQLCNFYLWDTNCELHADSYFYSFLWMYAVGYRGVSFCHVIVLYITLLFASSGMFRKKKKHVAS